jgi:transmembrane sensor
MKDEEPIYSGDDQDPDRINSDDTTVRNTKLLFNSLPDEKLPAGEKEQLWKRISQYVHVQESPDHDRPSRPMVWYRIAAVLTVFVLAGVGYKMLKNMETDVMQQVAQSSAFESADTRLMLADSRTIDLKGEHSDVVYEKEVIRLDSAVVAKNTDQAQKYGLNTLIVPYGKRSVITLTDGTKIWLNSGSKLIYPSEFEQGKREVFLEGQAYFAVAHDQQSPFYVKTERMNIRVLGTEFDVSSYHDDESSSAVLASGSIELVTNKGSFWGGEKNKMIPGTRAVYNEASERVQVNSVNVNQYVSWKDGYLDVKREPLQEILKKLSRYYKYDLSVQNQDIGQETFSGRLDLQDDIEQVVKDITSATSLNYTKSGRRYVLEKSTPSE